MNNRWNQSDRWNQSSVGSTDWLVSTVAKNPEGLLLLAAGCALLLRSGSSRTAQWGREQWTERDGRRNDRGQMPGGVSQMADSARDYASQVGQTVSQATQTVGETADRYATAAGEYANQARRAVVDQSGRLAEQAQSTIEKVVREQPLAVVIAGMAAGAAVAAAFPLTRVEHEALAGAGQRLSEAASSTSEKLSSAASAAGERLMSAAEERGLNAGGFKEVARDVASTFEDSLSGDDKDRKPPKESTGKQFSGSGHTETVGATGQVSNPTGRSTAKDRPGNK